MGVDAHEFARLPSPGGGVSMDSDWARFLANWKNIGPIANIPLQGARRLCLKSEGRPVAIFRTGEDDVFALIDECPHKKGPLSEGIVAGRTVTCPLHNWVIGLEDGVAIAPDQGRTAQAAAGADYRWRYLYPYPRTGSGVTRTTCPYCGVGCGVSVVDGVPRGDDNHPANFGRLCVKGAALKDTLNLPDRLTTPMLHGHELQAGMRRSTSSRPAFYAYPRGAWAGCDRLLCLRSIAH